MVKPHKIETVEDLRTKLSEAKGVYLADFQGMDVAAATELRNRCRAAGVEFRVVKNTLARRAFDDSVRAGMEPHLVGPTAIATSATDEIVPAKVISDFMKEFERPAFKAGLVGGRVMSREQVSVLAQLPGREVLLGRLVGGLKSPMQKLHSALSSPLRNLAAVLKQVSEQKA
jgi:large subunit ribosomal protein L10